MSLLDPLSLSLLRRRGAPRHALERLGERVRALDVREHRRSERVIAQVSAVERAVTALAQEVRGLADCVAQVAGLLAGEQDERPALAIEPSALTLTVGEALTVRLRGGLPTWARAVHWQAQSDGTAFEIESVGAPDTTVLRGVAEGMRSLLVVLEPTDATAHWPSDVFPVTVAPSRTS